MTPVVYLASQSPRRSQLLEQLGVRHELLLPDADENAEALEAEMPGEGPADYVVRVTGLKLDAAQAADMLRQLAGRSHRVLTAVAVGSGRRRHEALNVSQVRFAAMGAAAVRAYVASGEPMGKAGAYAVQGRAAAFIREIRGSYSGIMGLPLFETAALLQAVGHPVGP